MNEHWVPLPGFEGKYEVSDRGRVRSFLIPGRRSDKRRETPVVLRHDTVCGGYHKVRLQGRRVRGVHQLVAEAFLGPCPPGHEVDHIDCDPSNNCVSNLQYLTPEANRQARVDRREVFSCGHPVAGNSYQNGSSRTCHQCRKASWQSASAKRRLALLTGERHGHRRDFDE